MTHGSVYIVVNTVSAGGASRGAMMVIGKTGIPRRKAEEQVRGTTGPKAEFVVFKPSIRPVIDVAFLAEPILLPRENRGVSNMGRR
jgi:hypothetical protein